MRHLSGKEKKQLNADLPQGYEVDKKDEIIESDSILFKNKEPYLIIKGDKYLPHLKSVEELEYKTVFVDRGAIPFVLKGADLMRPGISIVDEGFSKDDIILIKDEEHKKTIAIGFALFDSVEMEEQEGGKAVKVYHFVGDEYYNCGL